MDLRNFKKELLVALLMAVLFLLASYFSQEYVSEIMDLFGTLGNFGMFLYVLVAMFATVVAPVSGLPLLPVAVALWGSFITALLSAFAWSLGAGIAFLLARRFGKPLVMLFVEKKKLEIFSKLIPEKYMFLAIVVLRISLPVDVLSYALGLFGVVPFRTYMLATVIGIVPFAFIFSYMVTISIWYQFVLIFLGTTIVVLSLPYIKRRYETVFLETRTTEKV